MICGLALRPARSCAGSADGKTLKKMKVIALTARSSTMPQRMRRTMYVAIAWFLSF